MNIQEAAAFVRQGKRVKLGAEGDYFGGSDFVAGSFTLDALASDDWQVEAEVPVSITKSSLAAAWDASRPASNSVGLASESPMFARLVNQLGL
jgi:hypothetical protein